MSRPKGSKNSKRLPQIITADDNERLEYLATLLLELVEEEIKQEGALCNQA